MKLFGKEKDYASLREETLESQPMRICAPNHWHFVLWPKHDGYLAACMQQPTTKNMRHWHLHCGKVGCGHVYQARYKSFPVEEENYFYQLARYVERNALRAALVERAQIIGIGLGNLPLDKTWTTRWQKKEAGSQVRAVSSLTSPVSFQSGGQGIRTLNPLRGI